MKQFPFTTTTRPPPRYSCYSLFPFRKPVSFHFPSFSFPLLCSGSRSLSNFTLDSASPLSPLRFLALSAKASCFFLFLLSFFSPPQRLYNPLTPRTRRSFVPFFFFASSLFCLVIDEAPFHSASSSSFVFVAHPPSSRSTSSSTSLSVEVQGGGKSRRNFNTSNVGEKEVSKVNLYKVAQELRFASSTSRYASSTRDYLISAIIRDKKDRRKYQSTSDFPFIPSILAHTYLPSKFQTPFFPPPASASSAGGEFRSRDKSEKEGPPLCLTRAFFPPSSFTFSCEMPLSILSPADPSGANPAEFPPREVAKSCKHERVSLYEATPPCHATTSSRIIRKWQPSLPRVLFPVVLVVVVALPPWCLSYPLLRRGPSSRFLASAMRSAPLYSRNVLS